MQKPSRLNFFATYFDNFFKTDDEKHKFACWAFGDDYENLEYALDYLEAWNRLHRDVLLLTQGGRVQEDTEKMFAEYTNYLNKKK